MKMKNKMKAASSTLKWILLFSLNIAGSTNLDDYLATCAIYMAITETLLYLWKLYAKFSSVRHFVIIVFILLYFNPFCVFLYASMLTRSIRIGENYFVVAMSINIALKILEIVTNIVQLYMLK
ncbi:hypothetical protein MHBO_003949 [Bonamia ostreae]|uniref:Uncharacterized protein n=1 Tax=Bonamia ostreae TaxID=126728 RepID=A0ABV2ARY7_9EUKA